MKRAQGNLLSFFQKKPKTDTDPVKKKAEERVPNKGILPACSSRTETSLVTSRNIETLQDTPVNNDSVIYEDILPSLPCSSWAETPVPSSNFETPQDTVNSVNNVNNDFVNYEDDLPSRPCSSRTEIPALPRHFETPQDAVNNDLVNLGDNHASLTSPYQPQVLPDNFPVQQLSGRKLTFQQSWFKKFTWLHVINTKGVGCFYCVKYEQACQKKPTLVTKGDKAFTENGFKNWKKAIEKFKSHEKSAAHSQAVLTHSQLRAPIEIQLSNIKTEQQKLAAESLQTIIGSLKFLVRQGLAIRGHKNSEGNLMELLKLRSEDKASLKAWLEKDVTFTHPSIQNEIIHIFGNEIVSYIVKKIKSVSPFMYSVICDGTRDISGSEQISICIRWVDADLEPHESFLGFYETANTCGTDIAGLIFDALLRLQLPLSNLRGQTYDGAGNMSGKNIGTKQIVMDQQPLAQFIHCGAHCVNLVMKASCETSRTVKNSLDWAHQLGVLFSQTKAKDEFKQIIEDANQGPVGNIAKIRPLCPTRWIYRRSQIEEILKRYPHILQTLSELADQNNEGASGLLSVFENGTTYLGLTMAKEVVTLLEILNQSFQGEKRTVAGLCASVEHIIDALTDLRTEEKFSSLYEEINGKISELGLEELQLPRRKRVPKRISGPADDFEYSSPEDKFRSEYFEIIDTTVAGLKTRILDQPGMKKQLLLEKVLLQKECHEVVAEYPEIDITSLKSELELLHLRYKIKCLKEAKNVLVTMKEEVRQLFKNTEVLVRLMLVCPASSCEAERSFSALRKLKNYLRSTMTQKRLNHVAVCYVHKSVLDTVDVRDVAKQFVNSDSRRSLFGPI